jgi:hypothetical protein
MKKFNVLSGIIAAAAVMSSLAIMANAESVTLDMQDGGYGINAGVSFTADGITTYESTLGDLANLYDTIDFTISVDDLGGRNDLCFQVYVSADNWAVWANGGETPTIEASGTEYKFSLDVDDIASTYGEDKQICDMGFQILSETPGDVAVTYTVEFNAGGTASDNTAPAADTTSTSDSEQKGSPDTGVEGAGAALGIAGAAAGVMAVSRRRPR